MNITYTKILHFLTVAKHLNMNSAAGELFVSQPALSLSISRLESDLGVTLFYRDRNKLILSREGEALYPRFEQLRQDYDSMLRAAKELAQPREQAVNISFSGSTYFFATFSITNLLSQYHAAVVKICFLDYQQALSMLLTKQLDFAVSSVPLSHPEVSSVTVIKEPIGLILPKGHPLHDQEYLSLADVAQIRLHGLTKHHAFRQICDAYFENHGITLQYQTEEDYMDYYDRIKGSDSMCGFLSTRKNYVTTFMPLGKYDYLTIDSPDLYRKISIYYLTNGNKQFEYSTLLEMLKRALIYQGQHFNEYGRSLNETIYGSF